MANDKDQENTAATGPDQGLPMQEQAGASSVPYRVITQYIADMSFENPHGVNSLMPDPETPPEVRLSVNLKHRRAGAGQFEVLLLISAQTLRGEDTLFIAELVYGAAVKLVAQVSQEELSQILLREVPRYLYPFARELLADITRRAGFPPLFLAPIDFDQMFESRKDQMPQFADAEQDEAAEKEAVQA